MKKKNIVTWGMVVMVICFFGMRACAQTIEVKVCVLDQDGKPLAEVKVDCGSQEYLRKKEGQGNRYEAELSNEKGLATIRSRKRSFTERISLYKEGYYYTRSITMSPIAKDYPPKDPIELTIKKIKNPIPMYAKDMISYSSKGVKIPGEPGAIVGYDLVVGDWVAPYGKGKSSDFVFQFEGDTGRVLELAKWERKITLRFSNENDGILVYKGLSEDGWKYGSDLVSDYEAPLTGYQPKWEQRTWKEKGGYHQTTRDIDRNFYFRVRTKVDKKGNIVSAYYGKIYGDFMSFIYYLNPTPNDRNVEFDPKKNLFKNEKVTRS